MTISTLLAGDGLEVIGKTYRLPGCPDYRITTGLLLTYEDLLALDSTSASTVPQIYYLRILEPRR